MKIVFLQDDFPPQTFGGAGFSVYELALGMKKAGHEVFVITTCREVEGAGESVYDGLTVFSIATDYHMRWRAYVSLYNRPVVQQVERLLKKIQPDIVHVNNVHQYLSYRCLKIANRYAKIVVFTARDVMAFNFTKLHTKRYLEKLDCRTTWRDHIKQAGRRWNPFRNFIIRRYLGYADAIFAISGALKEALNQNAIECTGVIYNGINPDEWHVDEDVVSDVRKKYNLLKKRVLLFGGRLSEAKGGSKTIEALAQIVSKVPNTVLLVAGKVDEYASTMKKQAESMGVEKNLIFTGWADRNIIKSLYAVADVVLMPSICFDAFGRVNIEAMAAHKPVVGTRYGGTPEIVVDGVTGYIVNPLRPQEIAQKSLSLLENPDKAKKFGEAGYVRLLQYFTLDKVVAAYMAMYNMGITQQYKSK